MSTGAGSDARAGAVATLALACLLGACGGERGPGDSSSRTDDATTVLVAPSDRIAAAIVQARAGFERIARPLEGFSSEGGEATLFLDAGTLRLAEATLYGEVGRVELTFFFDTQQRPILVERNTIEYEQPFGDAALETRERIYLADARIAEWRIDGARAAVAVSDRAEAEDALREIAGVFAAMAARR